VDLALAGRQREDFAALPSEPGLRILGEIPERDLPQLYSQALAFVYPSLYEGFGLPVLEAMQCGACVITSTDPAIGEVAGDAVTRLDPRDTRAWTEALMACATGGDWLDKQRENSLMRARHFSWERTARLTHEVYEQARRRFHG
jgi:glycosyltransferase involved in cell wall biosynthesis